MTTLSTQASTSSTSPITLFGLAPYDRSGKARWLLAELGVPHEDRWLNREEKEHEGEAYLRINPLGRIPAMQVAGRAQFESGAMCAYLADRYIDKGLAPAFDSADRLEYQQWMYFAAATLDPFVARIMIVEDIPAGEILDTKQTALLTEAHDAFEHLDKVLSKHDYLLASGFSAADVCVGYHLYFCMLWPEFQTILNAHPHLVKYLERLQARPAAVKADVFSFED